MRIRILGHEFPCREGNLTDDWLRVNFHIKFEIPGSSFGPASLDCTTSTLDGWRRRLEAIAAGRIGDVVLRTTRNGFSLTMVRGPGENEHRIVVDGRQIDEDLPGHLWNFTLRTVDVEAVARQCEAVLRDREAKRDTRPRTSIPNDPQRTIRANRRFLLSAG